MHFRYKQVVSGRILGEKRCPHCHEPFRAAFSRATGLMILLLVVGCVAVNMLMLRLLNANGLIVIFLSFLFTLVFFILLPLSVRYKDAKGKIHAEEQRSMIGQAPEREESPAPYQRKRSKSERIRIRKEEEKKRQETL